MITIMCPHRIMVVDKPKDIDDYDYYDGAYIGDDGVLDFFYDSLNFNKYHFDIVHWPYEKICYAIASLARDDKNDVCNKYLEEICNIAKKIYPNFKKFAFEHKKNTFYADKNGEPVIYRFVTEGEGDDKGKFFYKYGPVEKEVFLVNKDYEYRGAIAGGAENVLKDFLEDEKISLEEFITNDRYCVVCEPICGGNVWNKFADTLAFNKKNVVKMTSEFFDDGKVSVLETF